jgi:hypothetical protein
MTGAVADNDYGREAKAASTLHDFRDAVYKDDFLLQLEAGGVDVLAWGCDHQVLTFI